MDILPENRGGGDSLDALANAWPVRPGDPMELEEPASGWHARGHVLSVDRLPDGLEFLLVETPDVAGGILAVVDKTVVPWPDGGLRRLRFTSPDFADPQASSWLQIGDGRAWRDPDGYALAFDEGFGAMVVTGPHADAADGIVEG